MREQSLALVSGVLLAFFFIIIYAVTCDERHSSG